MQFNSLDPIDPTTTQRMNPLITWYILPHSANLFAKWAMLKCSVPSTESDWRTPKSIDDFTGFFERYIYNSVCIDDRVLARNKPLITQRMFDHISNDYGDTLNGKTASSSSEFTVSFVDLVDTLNKLTQNDFVHILNGTAHHRHHRSPSMQSMNSLHSIDEHTPLDHF